MSNKRQDIVDSWEEIDEARAPTTIRILKKENSATPGKGNTADGSAVTGANSLPSMLDEELRPKIQQRPMQILKRPQSNAGDGRSDNKPKTQIKSLDQRKQEYAEARLRILGSAHDEEEAEAKKTSPTTNGYRVNHTGNSNPIAGCSSSGTNLSGNSRLQPPFRQPLPTFPALQQQQAVGGPYFAAQQSLNANHPNHNHHNHQQQQQQATQQQQLHHPHHPAYQHQPGQHHFQQGALPPQQTPMQQPIFIGPPEGFYYHRPKSIPYGTMQSPMQSIPPTAHHLSRGMHNGFSGSNGINSSNNSSPNGHNNNNSQHVLRLPAGPDGSQGFSMRR